MGSTKLLLAQVGLQSAFGTGATPTINVPWVTDYEDTRELHEPEMDVGTWMPTEQVTQVSQQAIITATGDAFFEMLPVLLNSAIDDVSPEAGTGVYTHAYELSPTEPGAPMPLTFLIGEVNNNLGETGPAVKLIDQYVQSLKLSGNINDKIISMEANLFGSGYDDNSGKGYAFEAVALPATLEGMNAIKGELNIQDATTTGGNFETMTAFQCAMIDWTLTINTGLEWLWCLTDNADGPVGIRHVPPSVEFEATIRTSATNYALVKAKHDARTYQELQLIINGNAGRKATFNMTGRWIEAPSAHMRENDEVVMKATFGCRVPALQTTTPHFFDCAVISTHNWESIK